MRFGAVPDQKIFDRSIGKREPTKEKEQSNCQTRVKERPNKNATPAGFSTTLILHVSVPTHTNFGSPTIPLPQPLSLCNNTLYIYTLSSANSLARQPLAILGFFWHCFRSFLHIFLRFPHFFPALFSPIFSICLPSPRPKCEREIKIVCV